MRFSLETKKNAYSLMRNLGYRPQRGEEPSFSRSLQRGDFPRFHLYLEKKGDKIIFNLHLDQKKPSYEGSTAHSGEYDTDIVKKEAERIIENLK